MNRLINAFIFLLIGLTFSFSLFSQPPNKMNYQAVVRGSDGNVWANKTVGLQISILQGSDTGPAVFVERHTTTTNANGLVTVVIGTGSVIQGAFSTINWANGPYFLKTETDLNGGTAYTISGTKQLMSVPYALFAISSGTMSETDPIFGASPAKSITDADITNWNNKLDAEVDGSIQNELQTLTINGNQLTISKGNTVILPSGGGGGGGDQWGSQVVASDGTLNGDGTAAHPLGVNVNAGAFDDWDKDASDDFSGNYEDLTNKPDFSGWDQDASDDFSGNFNDLTNKPLTFYKASTTEYPTSITDNIYHTGKLALGTTADDSPGVFLFYTKTDNTKVKIGSDYRYTPPIYAESSKQGGYVIEAKQRSDYTFMPKSAFHGELFGGKVMSDVAFYMYDDGSLTNMLRTDSYSYYGMKNEIETRGEIFGIGVENDIETDGSRAFQVGTINTIKGTGNCNIAGTENYITNSGNGIQYGIFNQITGSGSGNKYGSYNYIQSRVGGTHYAVYADARKAGSYAGYFKGDVYVSKKLKGDDSGDADMKAYIYGYVNSSGNILTDGSSSGFSVTRVATGKYKITFTDSPGSYDKYIAIASVHSFAFVYVTQSANYFHVYIRNSSGSYVNAAFTFVVYKK
jgi:hypothetical protein